MEFTKDPEQIKILVDLDGNRYQENPDGSVSFGDVARNLLGEQCQYASRYINAEIGGYPKLGNGLRFTNLDSASYHDIGIHSEDIEEFRRRYEAYRAYKLGYIYDSEGHFHELSEGNRELLRSYLDDVGSFDAEGATRG